MKWARGARGPLGVAQEFVAFYGQEVQAAEMLEKIKAQIWEHKKRAFWQSLGLI